MKGITKRFGQVVANDSINLTIKRGEILALLGENGSGKTTLMNMLSGIYQPDEGEIYKDGKLIYIHSPREAYEHGIGMIHQHYKLIEVFTAAQNILLTACSLGLGAVWTAAFPYEDRMDVIRSCVCLPGDVKPLCIIPIGYPAKESVPKDKWNESRIHYNCWK